MALLEFYYGGTTSFKYAGKEETMSIMYLRLVVVVIVVNDVAVGRSVGVVYWIWHVMCILLCIVADRIDGLHSLELGRIRYLRYSYCVVKRTLYD